MPESLGVSGMGMSSVSSGMSGSAVGVGVAVAERGISTGAIAAGSTLVGVETNLSSMASISADASAPVGDRAYTTPQGNPFEGLVAYSPAMDAGLDNPGATMSSYSVVEQAEAIAQNAWEVAERSSLEGKAQATAVYAALYGISFSPSVTKEVTTPAVVREVALPQVISSDPSIQIAPAIGEVTPQPSSTITSAAKAMEAAEALGLAHLVADVQTIASEKLTEESNTFKDVQMANVVGINTAGIMTTAEEMISTDSTPEAHVNAQQAVATLSNTQETVDTSNKTATRFGASSSVKSLPKEELLDQQVPKLEEDKENDPETEYGPVRDERANGLRRDIAGNVGEKLAKDVAGSGEKISGDKAAKMFENEVNNRALSAILGGFGPDGTAELAAKGVKGREFTKAEDVRVALVDGINNHTAVAPGLVRQVSDREVADVFSGRRFGAF